jgi:hypothetical protein
MAEPEPDPPAQPHAPRTAREVIDVAIRENRPWEWVSFGLTIGFAVVGLVVLGVGAYQGNGLVALAGSVAGALFWPALRNAVAIRRANIGIRLLEVHLAYAKTAQQAADAIRQAMGIEPEQAKRQKQEPANGS